jgi:hypothetical protein
MGVFLAAFGTILAVTYPTTLLSEQVTKGKARSLRKAVAKSLRPGASKSQVIAFLASRKISYSELAVSKIGLPEVLAGHTEITNQIDASLPGHNWFSFFTYSVHVTFFFDDKDRLIDSKTEVDSYCDCP